MIELPPPSGVKPPAQEQTVSGHTQAHAPAPVETVPSGVRVPGYRIIGMLGRGGMGVVYQAVQEKAHRLVALKMILSGAHAEEGEHLRFRAEAEAAARLSHPNIVQLYEVDETPEGIPYFSLEFVGGGTLLSRLKAGPLKPREAALFLESLARAMHYAHERGIVHRDLKPANILLEGNRDQQTGIKSLESGATISEPGDKVQETGIKSLESGFTNPESGNKEQGGTRSLESGATSPWLGDKEQEGTGNLESGVTSPWLGNKKEAAGNRTLESGATTPGSGDKQKDTLIKILNEKTINRTASADSSLLVPKISDFGLAKQLDAEDGLTRTGAIMGTPSYMAPEQAFGQSKNVGPAADIYALGAILYECLTGRPPFKGVTVADTLDQVRTMEAVGVRAFVKEIPADLDTICLHCLHKEPARRYPSAEALAEDLRRFREGQPISVRPVSRLERGWRWCRRNPVLASMIGLAAGLLIAVAGISAFAYFDAAERNVVIEKKRQEAVAAQKVAKQRLDQSLKALGLFATDFRLFCEDALVPGKNKAKLYEVLIKQLESQIGEDAAEASEDSLRNKVWMYQTIAIVYLDTQQLSKAKDAIEKGLNGADQWLQLKPGDPYGRSYRAAMLSLKADLVSKQDKAAAKVLYLETLKLRRELAGNEAVDQYTPGRSLMQLADTLDKLHLYDESLTLREKTVKLQEEKRVETDKLFESLDFWAWTCWKAYVKTSDVAKKKAHLVKADELSRRIIMEIRPGARRTLERWSGIARELGDREVNLAKLAEKENNSTLAKQHADAAQRHYQDLANISRQLAVSPDLMHSQSNYARSFYHLGIMQKNLGNDAEARASLETSRHIREQLLRDYANHPNRVHLQIDLLFSLVALGEHARAVKEADQIQSAPLFVASPGAQSILYRLACIYSLSVQAVADARRPASLTDADKKLQAVYRDKALTALETSHALGNRDFYTTRFDAELISIRGDPRYARVLELEKKLKPRQ